MTSRLPALALAAALLGFSGPASAGSMKPPTGDLRNSTQADVKPHPGSSKMYNEFWTYHLNLDNDIQAVLNFSRVNLGSFKDPVCGADFSVMGFRGKNYAVAREYDKKNFKWDEATGQLRVHENIWFQGTLPDTHRLHFSTSKKGVTYLLDLEFSDISPGKVWGDGIFKLGGESIGIFLHIPEAKVTGVLAINNDTLHVTGTAYMDHTVQTNLAPKLVECGFRYTTLAGPAEVGYFLYPVSDYGRVPVGYGLRRTADGFALLKPASLTVASRNKYKSVKVPTKMEFAFSDSTKAVLERASDRYRTSTLSEFGPVDKMVIRGFMGGEIYLFRGQGTLNGNTRMAYNYFIVD